MCGDCLFITRESYELFYRLNFFMITFFFNVEKKSSFRTLDIKFLMRLLAFSNLVNY